MVVKPSWQCFLGRNLDNSYPLKDFDAFPLGSSAGFPPKLGDWTNITLFLQTFNQTLKNYNYIRYKFQLCYFKQWAVWLKCCSAIWTPFYKFNYPSFPNNNLLTCNKQVFYLVKCHCIGNKLFTCPAFYTWKLHMSTLC